MNKSTTSQHFFEEKYCANPDPWQFGSSDYELSRYERIFGAINHKRYLRVFEPGCSIGVLTAMLASIADQVVAMDISPTAVLHARQRCRLLPNVSVFSERLPAFVPPGKFDLIVFSELGYYFDEEELKLLGETLVDSLRKPGHFVAAHWLGCSEDHVLSGDRVHSILGSLRGLALSQSERYAGFRLDCWDRE